jgi:hypothetical protein
LQEKEKVEKIEMDKEGEMRKALVLHSKYYFYVGKEVIWNHGDLG